MRTYSPDPRKRGNATIDKLTEGSTIPACHSHVSCLFVCFYRDKTEGIKFSKRFVFVCVCCASYKFVSGLILWIFENFWFDDLCAE